MNWNEIRGLKYFILYALIIMSGYAYANSVGWKLWNATPTTQEKSETHGPHHGPNYFYHK